MEKHYEFTGETLGIGVGRTLQRIRATRDLPRHGVSAGDLGGWVESEHNLSENAWVHGDAWVYGNAKVSGNALVYGHASVSGNALVYGNAWVSGDAWVYGDAQIYGDACVQRRDHVLMVAPIGSEGVTATLFRTVEGHTLAVGCWDNGTLETLAAKVEARAKDWYASECKKAAWRSQYEALYLLGVATVKGWSE